jgi:peptide/nickel transport system permease protein
MSDALANLTLLADRADAQRSRRRGALAVAVVAVPLALVMLLAVAGPWLAPHPADEIVARPYAGARAGLWLGADHLGRDVFSRTLCGGRSLLLVPLVAVPVTAILGTVLGTAAAYLGGALDAVVTRTATVVITIPPIVVLLVLLAGWGAGAPVLALAIILTGVPFVARLARATALPIVGAGYVEQAVALGEGRASILAGEIAPNVAGPILADAGLRLVAAIYLVAAAGFLGFTDQVPNWGAMLSENLEGVSLNPWSIVAPATLLALLTTSANLLLDRAARRVSP